jgi:hypothetical protein
MPIPRFEVPSGAINGTNMVFTVSVPYLMGSSAVFINGMLMRPDYDDGWIETDPAVGEVTLKVAPLVLDVVQIFFLDTSPRNVEEEVTPIRGVVVAEEEMAGRFEEEDLTLGMVEDESALIGLISEDAWVAVLETEFELRGQLFEEC